MPARSGARGALPNSGRARAQVSQGGRDGGGGRWIRQIFSTGTLGKVLALGVLVGSAWLFYQGATTPVFRLSQSQVQGANIAPMDDILSVLPTAGTNIFTVRTPRLAYLIESIPSVERAEVSLVLPSTIRVTVHERDPKAVWDAGGHQMLVDAAGLVLADTADLKLDSPLRSPQSPLATIHAPEGPVAGVGDHVDPKTVEMATTISLDLGQTAPSGVQVEYHPSTGLTLIIPGAYQVMLGFGGDVPAKLAAYRAIRAHLEQTHTTAQLVDVRFLERPYYR